MALQSHEGARWKVWVECRVTRYGGLQGGWEPRARTLSAKTMEVPRNPEQGVMELGAVLRAAA